MLKMIDTSLGAGACEPVVAMGCCLSAEGYAGDGFKDIATELIG